MQAQKKYVFVAISIQVLVSLTTFAGEWSLSKKPDVSLVEESDVETLDKQIIQLEKAGKYSEAVPLATKLLKSCEELMGADHPATAIVLGKLARLYDAAGDYGKAEALFQRALKICESALGPQDNHTGAALYDLAGLYHHMGDYAKAEPLFERALQIVEKNEGPDSRDTAATLNDLALVYLKLGKYAYAESTCIRALRITEKEEGADHPDTAASCDVLAAVYEDAGDYAKAEALYLRALNIDEKVLGADHPNVAMIVGGLGANYEHAGNYAKAESAFRRGLAICEKSLGPEHPETAQSLNNLAALYEAIGDYASAEPLYNRSLMIREKRLGQDHPDTALSLNNLADLYREMGDYGKAKPLYERALKIYEKSFGPNHRMVASTLNNLGVLYLNMGAYNKTEPLFQAEPFFQRALKIDEAVLGENHPETAALLRNLGWLYDLIGEYAKAEPVLKRALSACEKGLGKDHPDTASSLNNLALLELDLANVPEARALALKLAASELKILSNILSFCSEQQRLAYQGTIAPYTLFAAIDGSDSELASACLRYKGVVLDSIIEDRMLAERSKNKEDQDLIQRLNANKQRLGQILLETPKALADQSTKQIQQLEQEVEQIEGKFARNVADLGRPRRALAVKVEEVQAAIPGDGALIEYLRYQCYLGKAKFEPRYGAIVLTTKGKPRWIPLGKADEIEKSVRRYRGQVTDRETTNATLQDTLRRLFDQVWKPVQEVLPENTRIAIISPDGQLNFVSFATLLSSKDRFLAEDYSIQYVSSGRDLLHDVKLAKNSWLITFGNPDFSLNRVAAEKAKPATALQIALRGKTREDLEELQLDALEGTKAECAVLAERAKQWKWPSTQFLAADATEAELRRVQSPHILHLATHGFVLDAQKEDHVGLELTSPLEMRKTRYFENPMHRAGLALAGAQTTIDAWRKGEIPPTENDGIVTAEEVSTLNLQGTWLVTLSACNTGVGEAKSGEGVLGLRRGFIQAGAKDLLMTLWPISDETTVDIMAQFYEAAHKTGNAPKSLAEVQRDWLVKLRNAKGLLEAVNLAGPFILNSQGKP
jgi:CHAT domain-containing protein/Tfp pilus assembly protein PilF